MIPSIEGPKDIECKNEIVIIEGILKKVPEKYLVGLKQIVLHESIDEGKRVFYRGGTNAEIHLDMSFYKDSKIRFLSVFFLNIDLLSLISEHIVCQNNVSGSQIIKFKGRINRNWMYFGRWTPIAYILYALLYPLDKMKKTKLRLFNKALGKIDSEE